MRYFIIALLFLSLFPFISAHSHYSYEHAEELKPLINWQDYGPEAFNLAIVENKPIFLLLTAPSWCYWCQVYESEEYLFNNQIVAELNDNYIPVYVDADKRRDLTRQYLEGGWPSTTIMAPNKERMYGFSGPRPVNNMLVNLQQAAQHVKTQGYANTIDYGYVKTNPVIPTANQLNSIINGFSRNLLLSFDPTNGGFGSGQKFPQGRSLDFALELYDQTGEEQWLNIVETTLENQYTYLEEIESNYNLYDPVEGGFHRYGTKADWTPPHYEKMLYDNARLLKAYFHLSKINPDNDLAKEVVEKTDQKKNGMIISMGDLVEILMYMEKTTTMAFFLGPRINLELKKQNIQTGIVKQ